MTNETAKDRRARNTAVWPEATDEQLSLPEDQLKEVLRKRLPALITAFLEDTSVVYPECTSF